MAENNETQVAEKQSEADKKWVHPLGGRKVFWGYESRDYSWKAWLADWSHGEYLFVLVNHLHIAYDSEPENRRERRERTLFFLNHAIPHCSVGDDCPKCKVAAKAASVLCQRVFKSTSNTAIPSWFVDIVDPEVLPKLFQLLALDGFSANGHSGLLGYNNGLSDHERIILKEFLLSLCSFAWSEELGSREQCWPWNEHRESLEGWRKLLEKHRPEFLKILWQMGELEELWKGRRNVTAEDRKVLRGFVFAKPKDYESDEAPTSLGGALTGRSRKRVEAARTLCWLEEFSKEAERQKADYENAEALVKELKSEIRADRVSIAEIQASFMSGALSAEEIQEKQKALVRRQEVLCAREAELPLAQASLMAFRRKRYGY